MPLPVYLIHYEAPGWLRSAAASILASDIDVSLTVLSNSGHLAVDGARVEVLNRNAGYAGAGNVAIREWLSGSEAYAVIGSHDLHVQPDTLRLLVEWMDRETDIGIGSPDMSDAVRGRRIREHDYEWLSGQCLVYRRACIEQVGGFDTRFGSYVEDVDIGIRAWDAGWRVSLLPAAKAHGLGSAFGSVSTRRGLRWPNLVGLARKHRGVTGGLRALAAQIVLAARALRLVVEEPHARTSHLRCAWDRIRFLPRCIEKFVVFSRGDPHLAQQQAGLGGRCPRGSGGGEEQ